MRGQFYGKYQGTVTNNQDTEDLGRIKARVPAVFGDGESGWAKPCVPFSGDGLGFFVLPDEGASVWIEFELGDSEYPIWSGCWWRTKQQRPDLLMSTAPDKLLIKTKAGHSILLDDTQGSGGITLETADGQRIVINSQSIEIDNGNGASLKLTNNQVSINDGALEVT